ERRRGLDHHGRIRFYFRSKQIVKTRSVEFAECKVVRVGEVDNCYIKWFGHGRIEPDKCIRICEMDSRIVERVAIQLAKRRYRIRDLCHFGIEIDNLDELNRRIFFDLAQSESVAAAENKNTFRLALVCGKCRMDKG